MNLFELKLNAEGIKAIKRFEKVARWTMALVVLISSILLLEAWTTFFLTLRTNYGDSTLTWFQVRAYPFYMSVYSVLGYLQAHYFLKTGKQLSFSIDNNDEIAFNRSFIFLLRNSIYNLLGLSLALMMTVVRVIAYIQPYYS